MTLLMGFVLIMNRTECISSDGKMQRFGRNHVNLFIRVYFSLRDENRGKAAFSRFVRLSRWSFLLWGLSRVSQHGAGTRQQVRTLKSAAGPWDSLKIKLIHEYDDLITAQLEGRGCDTTPYILYAYIKPRVCTWIREKLNEKKPTNLWDSSALGGAGPGSAPCFETSTLVWTLDPGQSDCLLRKNEKILYSKHSEQWAWVWDDGVVICT